MSPEPSFANLRNRASTVANTSAAPANEQVLVAHPLNDEDEMRGPATRPASRQGRKQIAGFFAPEMSFAMHTLARRQGRSLQSLMAEAFNDVLRKHGESPIGD